MDSNLQITESMGAGTMATILALCSFKHLVVFVFSGIVLYIDLVSILSSSLSHYVVY